MNNYEFESALKEKADKWELRNVQNENRELKNKISELERNIDYIKHIESNRHEVFVQLLNLLAEHNQFACIANNILELKNNF
ncbi:MAG: hypothetical protein M0R17_06285 [Candidatus Omnitrophica bacterium]|jgi:hypothetical protein|nr:hypothetical protein [Candidatus Omnitrophota bacterium]